MREIKFRAWDTYNKRMVAEPYRFVVDNSEASERDEAFKAPFRYYESWQDEDDGISRPCHIMQFTGLKDKNGKEIYEGDIVKSRHIYGEPLEVVYSEKEACFKMAQNEYYMGMLGSQSKEWEIIGNIYENPELLKP